MTRIRGMAELKVKLARLQAAAPAIAGSAADTLADGVKEDAERYAPVDTGRLQESIQITPDGNVATDVDYDVPVEYGTVNMAAQPFMRPAADGASRHVPEIALKAKAQVEAVV